MTEIELRYLTRNLRLLGLRSDHPVLSTCPHVVIEIENLPPDRPRHFECVLCRIGTMVPRDWSGWPRTAA